MTHSSSGSARLRHVAAAACLLGITTHGIPAQTAAPTAAPGATVPQPYVPLTLRDRANGYVRGMFGPMAWTSGAVSAGIGQWRDSPHEWGQGASGFGLRYGSGFGTSVTRATITFGAAALLHEDNRYFRSQSTATGARLRHAIFSTFLARKDDGTRRFSFSRIGGMFGSAMISRTWQPQSNGGFSNGMTNFGTQVGVAAGLNVAREFLPKRFRIIK
jgi:hypothetical protein